MKQIGIIISAIFCSLAAEAQEWMGTWATATELCAAADLPTTCSLSGQTVQQTVHVSVGGENLRVKLSNRLGEKPLEIRSVSLEGRTLRFDGQKSVTLPAGETVLSEALTFSLKPLQHVNIVIEYGAVPEQVTGHRGSRTTTRIGNGETVERWYTLDAIEVQAAAGTPCIAILGDSITDGRGSTTDAQNRWSDVLSEALGGKAAVLNLGIGGNCVLQGGLGEPALERFERDILGQTGVSALIIAEGINDIGGSKNVEKTARQLIRAYEKFIGLARERGLKVYLATITPLGNTGYWSHFHEACRQTVNDWIRACENADGILDFDALLRDPDCPTQLRAQWQYDWLHPNAAGYREMGRYAAEKL